MKIERTVSRLRGNDADFVNSSHMLSTLTRFGFEEGAVVLNPSIGHLQDRNSPWPLVVWNQ